MSNTDKFLSRCNVLDRTININEANFNETDLFFLVRFFRYWLGVKVHLNYDSVLRNLAGIACFCRNKRTFLSETDIDFLLVEPIVRGTPTWALFSATPDWIDYLQNFEALLEHFSHILIEDVTTHTRVDDNQNQMTEKILRFNVKLYLRSVFKCVNF